MRTKPKRKCIEKHKFIDSAKQEFAEFLNECLSDATDVDSEGFQDTFNFLEQIRTTILTTNNDDKNFRGSVRLKDGIALKMIMCISEYCHKICTDKSITQKDIDRAMSMMKNMFTFIKIPIDIWIRNIVYVLSMTVVVSAQSDKVLIDAIGDVIHNNPMCEKAYLDMCKNVIARSNTITYKKAFDLNEYAHLYYKYCHKDIAELEIRADTVALSLLIEENEEKQKAVVKTLTKKRKCTKQNADTHVEIYNDDSELYDKYGMQNDNEYDFFEELYWDELYSCFKI